MAENDGAGAEREVAEWERSGEQAKGRLTVGRERGVAKRSGERKLQKNDGAEQSVEQEVAERQRSGERGLHK